MNTQLNMDSKTSALRAARIAVFTALSVIGSFITPYPLIQTIAFDSAPGFFAALYFGALDDFIITGLGHIITAIINGFPLGSLHYIIALGMAMAGGTMGLVNKTNKKWGFIPATIAAVSINTGLSVIMVPTMGWTTTFTVVAVPLLMAASLNAVLAAIIYVGVRSRRLRA